MRRLPFLILLLAAASLACSLLSTDITSTEAPAPPEQDVLFQDDFSSTSSGWDRISVEEGVTDYADGVYRIYVNTSETDVWANPGLDFSDVRVEVEATKVGGDDDNDFGLICRYSDSSNFYFFVISSDGYYGIGRVLDGSQELIGETAMLPTDEVNQGEATNLLRADCDGEELSLYVNGVFVASQMDSSFSAGDVGLIAGSFATEGTDIHFDNFVVRQP
jgi:hypothetical protein